MDAQASYNSFIDLSANLTGFNIVHLYGTGQGEANYETLQNILGSDFVDEMLEVYRLVLHEVEKGQIDLKTGLRRHLLSSEKWGPVCRNLIKLWYLGSWYELPADWQSSYVSSEEDITHVISPQSFIEGLVWKAMKVHPKSAKQPGYGTWAFPPK